MSDTYDPPPSRWPRSDPERGGVAETKLLRRVLDEAVARADELSDTNVSERVVRYFLDNSSLARLIGDINIGPEDVGGRGPSAAATLRRLTAQISTWLREPGISQGDVIARLTSDVANAIERSEAAGSDDLEDRVDLVLTAVSPVSSAPRVADLVRVLADIASRNLGSSWGMAHSAEAAGALLDDLPRTDHLPGIITSHRTLSWAIERIEDARTPADLQMVAGAANSIAIGILLATTRDPDLRVTQWPSLVWGVLRVAALTANDEIDPVRERRALSLLGRSVDPLPGSLLVAMVLEPGVRAREGNLSDAERTGLFLLDAMGAAVLVRPDRVSSALRQAGVALRHPDQTDAANTGVELRARRLLFAASAWVAFATSPSVTEVLRRPDVGQALVHLVTGGLLRDDESSTSTVFVLRSIVADLVDPHSDMGDAETTAAAVALRAEYGTDREWSTDDLGSALAATLEEFGADPIEVLRSEVARTTTESWSRVEPVIGMWGDGAPILPWLTTVIGRLGPLGETSLTAGAEVVRPLALARRSPNAMVERVRDEWRFAGCDGGLKDLFSALDPARVAAADARLRDHDGRLGPILRRLGPHDDGPAPARSGSTG